MEALSTLAAAAVAMNAWAFWTLALAAGIVLIAWTIFTFNRLVREKNLMREAWSGIDVQLKRRANLIPNLVEVVTGYGDYERTVLANITALRTRNEQADDLKQREAGENALTDQLRGLFALAESYPDLKANRNFLALQEQIAEIEDQLQFARRYYNGAVRNYNIRTQSFPSHLVAKCFGYRPAEFFQIETATDRGAPKVEM